MRLILLLLAACAGVFSSRAANAQTGYPPQRQLPPLTVTIQGNTAVRTQASSDPRYLSPVYSLAITQPYPPRTAGSLPDIATGLIAGRAAWPAPSSRTNEMAELPPPPSVTLQQIQNPSGGSQLTHAGFSQSQYFAPNTYLGPEYHDWSNLRTAGVVESSDSYNRFEPSASGYYAPNTFIGPAFNHWSNFSSGGAVPSPLGSWEWTP